MEPLAYGAVGVVVGASITVIGNLLLLFIKEWFDTRKEKKDIKRQRLKTYNKILAIDARHWLVTSDYDHDLRRGVLLFNDKIYSEEITKALFDELHIFPIEIRIKIEELNRAYKEEYPALPQERSEEISRHYNDLIVLIKNQYSDMRS